MPTVQKRKLELIKNLYYENGLSAQEIADHLGVKLNAVYYFMRINGLARRDTAACNHLFFQRKPLSFNIRKSLSSSQKELKLAGVFLYWCEGAKGGNTVDFANSDATMCQLFIRFLREICRIDESRLRGYIYCHENQNPNKLIDFWSQKLKIPNKQFTKPYVRIKTSFEKNRNPHPSRMHNGLVHIRYNDLKLLDQIKTWINELGVGSKAVNCA